MARDRALLAAGHTTCNNCSTCPVSGLTNETRPRTQIRRLARSRLAGTNDSASHWLLVDSEHRQHAQIGLVIRDLKNHALAHLPSGHHSANGAWTVIA